MRSAICPLNKEMGTWFEGCSFKVRSGRSDDSRRVCWQAGVTRQGPARSDWAVNQILDVMHCRLHGPSRRRGW
jgi:hypothetical protein